MPERIVRVWYKDGSFIDVLESREWEYENDPDFERAEIRWPLNEGLEDSVK
jgi:hypothetical protein